MIKEVRHDPKPKFLDETLKADLSQSSADFALIWAKISRSTACVEHGSVTA